jgi:hypothetical protein
MAELTADQRRRTQQEALAAPRRPYGPDARMIFWLEDVIWGKARSLPKFKARELVARAPYQAWEQVAYFAITNLHERTGLVRRIYERVSESRRQQDNEQWHLLILEELINQFDLPEDRIRFGILAQAWAFAFYQASIVMSALRPRWSYRLNADIEDHAEYEYASLVDEHPDWESTAWESMFVPEYGKYDSLADLFRQIGYDERVHREASEAHL